MPGGVKVIVRRAKRKSPSPMDPVIPGCHTDEVKKFAEPIVYGLQKCAKACGSDMSRQECPACTLEVWVIILDEDAQAPGMADKIKAAARDAGLI